MFRIFCHSCFSVNFSHSFFSFGWNTSSNSHLRGATWAIVPDNLHLPLLVHFPPFSNLLCVPQRLTFWNYINCPCFLTASNGSCFPNPFSTQAQTQVSFTEIAMRFFWVAFLPATASQINLTLIDYRCIPSVFRWWIWHTTQTHSPWSYGWRKIKKQIKSRILLFSNSV